MKKRNKTMYFLFMITLFSCTYPGINRDSDTPRKQKIEDVSPGITKSVIAPEFAGYVGDGYDMLKLNTSPIESLKGQCLTDLEVRRVIGEARTNTNNFST
ncbi:MAG: hypothetical protein JXB50_01870, partial [Spirochaetes bacterium]|nr:hypothetical protein [Spirochaetota bacterium]